MCEHGRAGRLATGFMKKTEPPIEDELIQAMVRKFSAMYEGVNTMTESTLTTSEVFRSFTSFAGLEISEGEFNRVLSAISEFKFDWDPLRKEFVWLVKSKA